MWSPYTYKFESVHRRAARWVTRDTSSVSATLQDFNWRIIDQRRYRQSIGPPISLGWPEYFEKAVKMGLVICHLAHSSNLFSGHSLFSLCDDHAKEKTCARTFFKLFIPILSSLFFFLSLPLSFTHLLHLV